jgi:hypothetical protein
MRSCSPVEVETHHLVCGLSSYRRERYNCDIDTNAFIRASVVLICLASLSLPKHTVQNIHTWCVDRCICVSERLVAGHTHDLNSASHIKCLCRHVSLSLSSCDIAAYINPNLPCALLSPTAQTRKWPIAARENDGLWSHREQTDA